MIKTNTAWIDWNMIDVDTDGTLTWKVIGTHYNIEGKVPTSEVYQFASLEWAYMCKKYMDNLSPVIRFGDSFATSGLLTFSGTDGGFYVSATSPPTLGDVLQNTWAEVKPKIIRVTNALLWGEKGKQCK
jgi:hypothetical protein